jgi:hypothetical protein
MTKEITFRDPTVAFKNAIENGTLTDQQYSPLLNKRNLNYAGSFMYMYSVPEERKDYFKHCDTRKYLFSRY